MTVSLPQDAERACEALWRLGGTATRGALAQALPDVLSAQGARAQILSYAERQNWIVLSPRRVELTGKGASRFGPYQMSRESVSRSERVPAYSVPVDRFESVLARLPVQHGLFVRLKVCTVVARRHLAHVRNEPWPNLMALGGSGTGKTTMHRLISRLFGFAPVESFTVNLTQAHTRGALKGTVITGRGFVQSPYMSLPYLVFEELDKDPALIRIVDPYCLGEISHMTRGTSYRILPSPMILANPPDKGERHSLIHPAWRRRSILLDTQYLSRPEKERIEDFADWLDDPANLPPGMLDLEAFTVPERLSEPGKAVLQCVRELLSPDFRNRDLYPGTGPLELVALGYVAVFGCSHELAAWHTGLCYLAITETIPGQVVPDALPLWDKLHDLLGSGYPALRGAIRSSKSASEIARRDAEIAAQVTPRDLAMERVRDRSRQYQALREISGYLRLFDPGLFYDDTWEFEIAEQYCDTIPAVRDEIKSARNVGELETALDLWHGLRHTLEPHAESLRDELKRIEREESGEVLTIEAEPEPDSEPESESGLDPGNPPVCLNCRLKPAQFRVRAYPGSPRLAALRFADLCSSCYLMSVTQYGVTSDDIIFRYQTQIALPAPASRNPPKTVSDVMRERVESLRRQKAEYGTCAFPENHFGRTKILGDEPPVAGSLVYGNNSGTPGQYNQYGGYIPICQSVNSRGRQTRCLMSAERKWNERGFRDCTYVNL